MTRSIQEIFNRIQEIKREQRDINAGIRDALKASAEYRDVVDQMDRLKIQKRQIEGMIKEQQAQKLDLLKMDIKGHTETLSDVALSTLLKGESIRITHNEIEYEPNFSVKFAKAK
jgi:hypothetical protein